MNRTNLNRTLHRPIKTPATPSPPPKPSTMGDEGWASHSPSAPPPGQRGCLRPQEGPGSSFWNVYSRRVMNGWCIRQRGPRRMGASLNHTKEAGGPQAGIGTREHQRGGTDRCSVQR